MGTMKNGIINIRVFGVLDTIARKNSLKYKDWAEKAWGHPKYQSRISELKRKLSEPDEKVGRAFTIEKCFDLLNGLKESLGGELVTREMKKMLNKAKTQRERAILLVLAADDKEVESLIPILEAVVLRN